MSAKLWLRWVWLGVFLTFSLIVISVFVYGFSDAKGYTSIGIGLMFSVILPIMLFLAVFFEEIIDDWYVYMNPWVKDVEKMDRWFNPMFLHWVYYHDRQRWAKYTIFGSLPFLFFFGIIFIGLFTSASTTIEAFVLGFLVGAAFTTLVAIVYYQRFLERTESDEYRIKTREEKEEEERGGPKPWELNLYQAARVIYTALSNV